MVMEFPLRQAPRSVKWHTMPTNRVMMKERQAVLSTSMPRVSPAARRYVNQVLDFGIHNTRSAGMVARLEQAFADRFGRRFGIAHSNGTATMHSALLAADVGVGDEVIVPAYTVFMTASVALYANAIPVFVDVDPNTWTID